MLQSNLAIILIITLIHSIVWFIYALLKKRNDLADLAWGVGFVLTTWSAFFVNTALLWMSRGEIFYYSTWNAAFLINILVTVWGIRLFFHIYSRNKAKQEDYRYAQWRVEWGKTFYVRTFLQVFVLQSLLMLVVNSASIFANFLINPSNPVITWVYLVGVVVWCIGFLFESFSDLQLSKFVSKAENKDKIIDTGLWKYSRHPNYFGEVVQWWGIFIAVLGLIQNPLVWLTSIGPITITFLLTKVSGIPMLEKKLMNNSLFLEYARRTSSFFPWPAKKSKP